MKSRLFVDMDGTLTVFTPQPDASALYTKGYFLNLAPQVNVIEAVRKLNTDKYKGMEVFTLSAYLADSPYALEEKDRWIEEHLPEIDKSHRLFVTCGRNKKDIVDGGVRPTDFLLDDYTKNLVSWNPGHGIKLLNGINHTKGSWKYDSIRYDRDPDVIANLIYFIMSGGTIQDSK